MSLYAGLGLVDDSKSKVGSEWEVSTELLKDELKRKKKAKTNILQAFIPQTQAKEQSSSADAPAAAAKPQAAMLFKPSTIGKRKSPSTSGTKPRTVKAKAVYTTPSVSVMAAKAGSAAASNEPFVDCPQAHATIHNQYDPSRPNDFEIVKAHHDRRMAEMQQQHRSPSPPPRADRAPKAAIAPPSFLTESVVPKEAPPVLKSSAQLRQSGDDAYMRRMQLSQSTQQPTPQPSTASLAQSGEDAYLRRQRLSQQPSQPVSQETSATPTCVLMLENMASASEVDSSLSSEIATECNSFGVVLDCQVDVAPAHLNAPEDKAVRVFVKFQAPQESEKAYARLNGRFFGGRRVAAFYFNEALYSAGKLR
eukprot:m.23750 g.23750  ORF g.23750 m.23750 type:complete len:364 (+) comp8527_c0_seq1:310-1401(+)